MFKKIGILAVLFGSIFNAQVQKPKLVVGLVVDQMRWDYLHRFQSKYGENGFKRLLNEGYSLNNVMIDYVPTVTALGHTSIYTGSVPSVHGIAGNDWLNKETGEEIYCTTDTSVNGVGASSQKAGAHSPKNLWSTTITDQLGIATNFQSKVVGVSLKDRASILPAGHRPTGAFWFDDETGDFITSSYYMDELPKWLKKFNAKKVGEKLIARGWSTILPIDQYIESTADNVSWEGLLGSAQTPTFPYKNLAKDYAKKKKVIRQTPFGNTLTLEVAKAALDAYQMGRNKNTDFLAINLASTDYVGHMFAPNAIEIEDTYLRLDQDLASFFHFLDIKVGKGNYLVFLTADHGAAHAVGYMKAKKMPARFISQDNMKNLSTSLATEFGASDLVLGFANNQLYINHKSLKNHNLNEDKVKSFIIDELNQLEGVLYVADFKKVNEASIPEPIKSKIINGFNWKRSGDIQVIFKSGSLPGYYKTGTTHGAWNSFDSHIPLIFMGTEIKHGESSKPYHMTDIAPTLAQILKIENPSGTIGNPISEIID